MTDEIIKKCPKCGQQLRFPKDIGGVLMACPNCGKQFHSDFKLGNRLRKRQKNLLLQIFELPSTLLETIGRRIKR
jgi:DNA-directed RNA polymerase subunit M/transcription elongation factor TFIIS